MSVSKEVIASIRTKFLAQVKLNPEKYHPNDVQRVETNDWWVERFVLVTKTEDQALQHLVKTMEWRKSFGVNDFTESTFPEELYKIGLYNIYPHKDKEGRTVLWFRIGRFHKSELTPMIKQFIVYHFEKADRETSNQGWAVISDTTNSGLSNVDMDYSNFTTDILQNHYPRGNKYMAIVDLPWILNATSKLILAFMNEELRSTVKFMKKDELTQYIDPSYIPVHMKGSYDKEFNYIPTGAKPLEQFNFTADQIKKIRNAFKEELKA